MKLHIFCNKVWRGGVLVSELETGKPIRREFDWPDDLIPFRVSVDFNYKKVEVEIFCPSRPSESWGGFGTFVDRPEGDGGVIIEPIEFTPPKGPFPNTKRLTVEDIKKMSPDQIEFIKLLLSGQ